MPVMATAAAAVADSGLRCTTAATPATIRARMPAPPAMRGTAAR